MRIVKIRGKKYIWKPEEMHPVLLIGGFIAGLIIAAAGFWAFLVVTSAIWG